MPPETRRAVTTALQSGLAPFRAQAPQTLSQWAAENFVLSAESSHTQGRWTAYPFQRGLMDAFSDDQIVEVSLRKSKRVGYTKCLLALIGYAAAHRRRKLALWQPTDDDRDSFVKSEIEPMLRDVPAVAAVALPGAESTLKLRTFLGGAVLHTLGGKAARAYRRITVAIAALDETDGFDAQIEKSADPITLARGRLEGAPFPKLIAGSTPRVKGASHVEYREANADAVLQFHVVCPHCQAEHPLLWGGKDLAHGFKWDADDPTTVRHICPHCRGEMLQGDYLRIWTEGAWVSRCGQYRYGADATWRDGRGEPCRPPRHVAFHIWAAYSPQRTWADIVREFIEASAKAKQGDVAPLMGFVNETLGELWEDSFERADEHALARRAEPYRRFTVPIGGLVLVCGLDVQDNRFEAVTWAIGRGEEMWAVDYSVIYANPADEREWDKLDAYLATPFQHASGQVLKIEAAAIDTGGHFTHQVYNYARQRERRRIFAVKGDAQQSKTVKGKPTSVDVNWRGQVLRRSVKLWMVGVDTAKDLIHGRLQVTQPGAGYMHFSQDLPPEFYAQLTAEKRVPVRTSRGVETRWTNPKRARNEALDCTVYAIFAAHQLGLNTFTSAMWSRIEAVVQPPTADLFAVPIEPVQKPVAHPPPPAPPAPVPSLPQRPRRRTVGQFNAGGARW
jgi:phage terminase large subunit GpA-like protein